MAICSHCKQDLPNSRKHTLCQKCSYKYNRQRAEKYKQEVYKTLLNELGCAACGFNHPGALEVHHLCKGDKRFAKNGSRGQSLFYNKQDIEAGKAIILCANCHLLFHSTFGGRRADFPDQTKESTIMIIKNTRAGVPLR